MAVLLPILLFVLVLSFLVFIHELGHYISAKFFRVHVEEFGLGYPPRAVKLFNVGSTLFSLNWIPFGGFVKMEGEDGPGSVDESAEKKEVPAKQKYEEPFYKKSRLARLIIILSGAGVNFLFGILAFSLYFSVKGIPTALPKPRIALVAPESPAAKSGVPVGVDIKGFQIKDQFVYTAAAEDVIHVVKQHEGEHLKLVTTGHCEELECDTTLKEFDVYLRRKDETPANQGSLGIEMEPVIAHKFYPWPQMPLKGAMYGVQQAFFLSYFILQGLGQLVQNAFQGHIPMDVAGPVGIYSQAHKAGFLSSGVFELLNFAGILSVNLAIMNVLPLPALDGGRVFFILLEILIGKKRVQKVEGYANYGGFAVLLFLIVLITIKDIGTAFFTR